MTSSKKAMSLFISIWVFILLYSQQPQLICFNIVPIQITWPFPWAIFLSFLVNAWKDTLIWKYFKQRIIFLKDLNWDNIETDYVLFLTIKFSIIRQKACKYLRLISILRVSRWKAFSLFHNSSLISTSFCSFPRFTFSSQSTLLSLGTSSFQKATRLARSLLPTLGSRPMSRYFWLSVVYWGQDVKSSSLLLGFLCHK
jgi:hypothetical protein